MEKKLRIEPRWIRVALVVAGAALIAVLFYHQLGAVISIMVTAFVLAFIFSPLADLFIKWGLRNRALAVVCAFLVAIVLLVALALLLLPPLFEQLRELSLLMGRSVGVVQDLLLQFNRFLLERGLPQIDLAAIDWSWLTNGITGLLSGTKEFAGSMIGAISRFGLALMLAFYFLLYKESMLLSLELLIPFSARKMVLQMTASVTRELRQYLKGQMTIAIIVAALTAVGLALVGAPSPVMLGLVVGVFNLIPYFGPLIGSIPAVLMAMGQGATCALLTAVVLFVVQQLDGFIISPRVMSGMMGLSPPAVLLAITVGSCLKGIAGMFFAIPVLLIVRICLRVWASRNEMIEKYPEM